MLSDRARMASGSSLPVICTIGHSTRTIQDFIKLLQENGVRQVADIRTVPRSRVNPQFNRETLPGSLQSASIGYRHMAGMGGLRKPRRDSVNTAWRNDSFRGFADYMQSQEFADSLVVLVACASQAHTAIMCAEAVPWRCHRSLISDALTVRGITVTHIMSPGRSQPHRMTPWARVDGTSITYPAPLFTS